MNKNLFMTMLALAALSCSCAKNLDENTASDTPDPDGNPVLKTFSASVCAPTKTGFDSELNILWSTSDKIGIYARGTTAPQEFQASSVSDDGLKAEFTGLADDAEEYFAIYPYNAAFTLSSSSEEATVTLPSVQSAVAGSFDPDAPVAVSRASTSSLYFRNAVAFLKLTAGSEGIMSVKLTARGSSDVLSGGAILNIESEIPTVKSAGTSGASVTLSGNLVKGSDYYIVIWPGTFSSGFDLEVTNSDGLTLKYSNDSPLEALRNECINLGTLICDKKEITLRTLTKGASGYQSGTVAAAYATFGYPMGLAFDSDNSIYIAEELTCTIKKLTQGDNPQVSVFAGEYIEKGWDIGENFADGALVEARFSHPMDIEYIGDGTFFVADRYNNAVRKIKDGQVTTFGNRRDPVNDPWGETAGVTVTPHPIWGPDYGTYALDKWAFTEPLALYHDSVRGYLYVSSAQNYVVKVNLATNVVDLVAGFWYSGSETGNCRSAELNCLYHPAAMTMDSEGNLYIANQYGHFISKVDQDCNITVFAGVPGTAGNTDGAKESATFNEPCGIEIDSDGNLLVADFRNHCIRKIDVVTGVVSTWCGSADRAASADGNLSEAAMFYPTSLSFSPVDGNLYMTQAETYAAVRMFVFHTPLFCARQSQIHLDCSHLSKRFSF